MNETKTICDICKQIRNEEVPIIEKHGMLTCPKCQTSFFINGVSPLERFKECWNNNADEIFVLIRPELNQFDLSNPQFFSLYEDCYHTLLIGRYNASIIMMGVLLEAIMKERIRLKIGIDFNKPYGPCLEKIKKENLMNAEDIIFLRGFKDKVRNLYQHVDESKILRGVLTPVWPMQFEGELTPEKLERFMKDVNSGQLKPKLLPAAEIPAIRSIAKQGYDRKRAIELFNQVYDFLLDAKIKYFKQKEYDKHNKKFKTGLENVEHYKV